MRNPAFCICENKDADHFRGNREADQRFCFRYIDSIIPLLSIYEISRFCPFCVVVQGVFVGPGRKPRRPVFTQRGSYYIHVPSNTQSKVLYIMLRFCPKT